MSTPITDQQKAYSIRHAIVYESSSLVVWRLLPINKEEQKMLKSHDEMFTQSTPCYTLPSSTDKNNFSNLLNL